MRNTVTRSELIKRLIARGRQQDYSAEIIDMLVKNILELMVATLCKRERIEIRGFGSFNLRRRSARQARNPKTGQLLFVKASSSVHFKPGKILRERVDS